MRKFIPLLLILSIAIAGPSMAQRPAHPKSPAQHKNAPATPRPASKKYPSLLWEISGNGLKKPSYLFGTMHVSDKLAFHLGDSFYTAIKSADIVALETNPESWQDDYSQSVFFKGRRNANSLLNMYSNRWEWPSDHMRITSFAIDQYEEAIKAALAVEPSMINGMLYRTYGRQSDDFEEDTFLDMYIFQTGKKLGKRVSGVENFQESEKLVMEAYRDMVRDQNKKRRSYDYEGMMTNPKKVEDAYRKGDLDLLDSLENLTVFSDAFQEKFLYKRNEIQANSIDSIIKKMSLFVGVGAAHLPGKRGVIEILRQKGYTLRPVHMDDRNSNQKETVDKIRINNAFTTQTADDNFYSVAIPGKKFYRFTDWNGMDVVQYADMVNGAYYMVTRIKTNSLSWGHSSETVYRKIDSLLYENIPGKIIRKTPIVKNGYKGLDVINRTRRGDNQRYQIFVTPFEVVLFKISGNGEYVNTGTESQEFFGSIKLKEFSTANWHTWHPSAGGFSIQVPHTPSLLKDNSFGTDRLEYTARDEAGNSFLIMKASLHNYSFIEEDSFELNLMDESYGYSNFINKQLSRRLTTVNGYPALECKYKHYDGSFSSVKYIIHGPVYYAVIANYKNDNPGVQRFLQSFTITPYIYPAVQTHTDTLLNITVTSPLYIEADKKSEKSDGLEDFIQMAYGLSDDDDNDYNFSSFSTRLIGNDTIGEKILVTHLRLPQYQYKKDSTQLWKNIAGNSWFSDSTFIIKQNDQYTLANGMRCRDIQLTDTNSSRLLMARLFYKNGHFFSISTLTDTLSTQSPLINSFFNTFKPADTLKGESMFVRKTDRFFKDLFSKDTLAVKKARKVLYQVPFDSLDVPLIKAAIDSLNWNMKDYLTLKKYFIESLGNLQDSSITPWLQKLYWKVKDTADWQSAILNALLNQRTKASFITFKDLVLQEPPITDEDASYIKPYRIPGMANINVMLQKQAKKNSWYGRWSPLFDTLALTKVVFPEILQLMNIEDYRSDIMGLLVTMVDSGYLHAADYESYFPRIYLEGKQLLKKQLAKENKAKMERAARKDAPVSMYSGYDDDDADQVSDAGNSELDKYAVLLLPFHDKNPGVQSFFEQLLKTQDRRLLYNTFILLVRNNHKINDSLFMKYAQADEYRSELYDDLEKMKKPDRFPRQFKNQLAITKSLLIKTLNNYDKIDTLIYLDKLPVTYEHKKGYVYFYKYKRMRDDVAWQLASVGLQPEKGDAVDVENDDFTTAEENRKLETDKPVKEQLQKMLKEMLYARRLSASVFYDARSYSLYKNYLSEMVKSQRYRD